MPCFLNSFFTFSFFLSFLSFHIFFLFPIVFSRVSHLGDNSLFTGQQTMCQKWCERARVSVRARGCTFLRTGEGVCARSRTHVSKASSFFFSSRSSRIIRSSFTRRANETIYHFSTKELILTFR